MKKKALIVLLVSALLCVSKASLGETVRGFITTSCGQWVQESKTTANNVFKAALESAATAYLSGLAVGAKKDVLASTDVASIELWLTNYCSANPLDNLTIAVEALFKELMKRKGIK